MNKWDAVTNQGFRQMDLAKWQPEDYIRYLRFCEFFIVRKEDGTDSFQFKDNWKKSEDFLNMPDHPFQEYLIRINHFTYHANADIRKFSTKFNAMMNVVLTYIRKHPAVVSDKMREVIEVNSKFAWCLKSIRVVESPLATFVVPEKHAGQSVPSLEVQTMVILQKFNNVMEMLVDSISPKKIQQMDEEKKLAAIARLMPYWESTKNFKPNRALYQQINFHGATREQMEAEMLNLNKK